MFKLLNPFSDDFVNFLYQSLVMVFVIVLFAVVGYTIKYRNVVEICQQEYGLGGNTVKKTCQDVVLPASKK